MEELTPQQLQEKKLAETWEAADKKAAAISAATNRRVIPFIVADFTQQGEYVVGFMYRPDLVTQLRLSDKGQDFVSGFSMEEGSKVIEALLIVGESDPRINMTTDEGELYWKGAIASLFEYVKGARLAIKKK